MASGRPQGWAWQHFHTDKTKYKSNNPHLNAWCSGELKLEIEVLLEGDKEQNHKDPQYEVHSNEELYMQGTCQIYIMRVNHINTPFMNLAR
jgi:hypothetical protein